MAAEVTTRQNGTVNRLGRLEGQINHLSFDQRNALESSQETWRTIQETEMSLRLHETISKIELTVRQAQGLPHYELVNEMKRELHDHGPQVGMELEWRRASSLSWLGYGILETCAWPSQICLL